MSSPEVTVEKRGGAWVATWLSGKEETWGPTAPFANSQPSLGLSALLSPPALAVPGISYSKPSRGSTSKSACFPFIPSSWLLPCTDMQLSTVPNLLSMLPPLPFAFQLTKLCFSLLSPHPFSCSYTFMCF